MKIQKPRLFNENGGDSADHISILGGNSTGIANLNRVKYKWADKLYREMLANTWFPEKVDMTDDKTTIHKLTKEEDRATQLTLAFLIYLDNYQVGNLPNISSYITAPEIRNLYTIQAYQEVIHSATYQYMLQALYPSITRNKIYNLWKDDPILLERNKALAEISEEFTANPTEEGFLKILIANLALEGIFFYQGFNHFDQLSHRNKLVQADQEIDYIRKDEMTHMGLNVNVIKELKHPKTQEFAHVILKWACETEKKWCRHVYVGVPGITEESSDAFVEWLGNDRCKRIGVDPIYPPVKNPYKYIENAQKAGGSRKNFFESSAVTEYDTAESVEGWDLL